MYTPTPLLMSMMKMERKLQAHIPMSIHTTMKMETLHRPMVT